MNYRAELKGFSFDRAVRASEVSHQKKDLKELMEDAEILANFFYIPDKDIDSHISTLIPLITRSGDIKKIDNFILGLEQIKAEMEAGVIPSDSVRTHANEA